MKIAYNPVAAAAVITATTAANDDILFDLKAKKIWAKGLRMGADWADITSKPSSLKNPYAIKFRDINGNEVSYDGSSAKDLTTGTYIAKLPYGFSSFALKPTWGNTIGTSIASWNDSSGGSIDFRKDNPSSGKMSIKVDGRVYVNEGVNPVLSAEFNNSFWGMRTPDGGNDWIRTPNSGLIPYVQGNAGSGHSSLGTSTWYFSTAYIDKVYGSLKGNADTATTATKATKADNATNAENADKLDGWHKDNIQWTGYISSNTADLQSYWAKMYDVTITSKQSNDVTITFLVSEGFGGNFSIFHLKIRQGGTNGSGAYNLYVTLRELVGNLKNKIVAYYNNKTGNVQLWGNVGNQQGVLNYTILKKAWRVSTDFATLGTLTAGYFSTVQTQPTTDYTKVTMSRVGQVQYAESSSSSTQATKLQTARNLWGNSFDGTKDISGSITFPAIGDTATSNKISWSGSSDGADIYYQTTAKDQGNLVLNVKDDTNAYIQLALNGVFKSHFDVANSYWTGRSALADKWTTSRTFTIGNTAKNVDGSGNVSWSLAEIGVKDTWRTVQVNGTSIGNNTLNLCGSTYIGLTNVDGKVTFSLVGSGTTANQAILSNGTANGWALKTLNIANWDAAYNLRHSHSNKSVLDGITSALVSSWNTAYNFVDKITKADTDKVINKWDEIVNFLAGIDSNNKLNTLLNSKLSVYELADKTNVGAIKNNGIYYSTTDASSSTLTNSPFSNGFALINMTSYDGGDDLRRSRLAFNAYGEIKVSDDRSQLNTAETWYNVLTSKNSGISGSTIKLNGTSITVYSSGTADNRYVKKSGDTMTGALNFANGTWNLVGDDSYMGDCNVSGHFGIKAANTTYPGIAFFNNANAHLGSLTAYSGNIKYGAYSLQFLDNGNTSVGASTWTNPFSAYDKDAVKDGQAICVWGQSSRLSNLSTDTGDMSLWLKRVNANAATLNMVLDGEYYANGNQRLAHISEIPSSLKNPHALTISLNGTSQGPYDGSAAKSINITPGSIGAATSGHNHDGRYVYNYGGTKMDGSSRNKNALGISTTSGISEDWWHILQAAWNDEYRWNSQIAFPTQNRNGMYYRSGLDDNTKWGAWVKLLDTGNSSISGNTITINGSSLTVSKSDHNHDYLVVNEADEKSFNSAYHNFQVLYAGGSNGITGRPDNVDAFGLIRLRAAWGWSGQMLLANGGSLYIRSSADAQMTNTLAWRTILDSSNYSSILDSRYYTESEVNSLLSNKLNTSDFNWTNLPGKIVAENEFNIVNAGFKKSMWFNYLPINDRSKTAAVASYIMGNGAKGYASVQASGFIKSGGNVSQLLRADGGVAAFNWSGQSGQPTWLWGGNSQHSYYVYNPSNFRVAYAASAGNADTLDGEHANSFVRAGAIDTDKTDLNALDTYSFIKSVNSKVADHSPKRNTGWYNVIQLVHRNGSGNGPGYIGQIALGMTTNTDDMFFRTKYQNTWNSWKTVIHSGNIADQSVKYATSSGNADTLDKLHASAFLQLKNNRFTQYNKGTWTKILKFTTPASTIQASISFTWHPSECARNVWADFSINIRGGITFFVSWKGEERRTLMCVGTDGEYAVWVKGNKAAWDPYGVIQVTQTWDITSYETGSLAYSDITPTGTYSAEASMRGYVLQADRLITSRNINGTAFNGTKDITTSYWGTARNITIGKSIKSVNGSANVAWSLADIGAASDDHTHPYLPLAGGEMNNGAQITRKAKGVAWVQGRDSALIKDTTSSGYHALWSLKTKEGSWEFGESQNDINTDNVPVLTYITDTNYTNKKNTITYQQKFQLASGTIALTSQIPSSLPANGGNADTVDGYHAGGLFTAFGNENHNITATIGGVTKKFQVNYASDSDKLDGKHASDFATAGHNHDGRYLKLSGGTLTGGIEIQGTISGSNYASSEGFYTNEHNSLILRGDATYGKSGILFTSSKGTNSINQTSDKGFIQFQSYGEENKLVIGVGNDSTDMVYIQTPSVTGLKHVVGTNPYTIWDSGNLTKLSQLTNDKGFVTGSVNGKTITINGTSTTWSNTWRPISDDYEKGDASTSLSTLGSLTLYNDLLSAIPTIPTIPNPTNYYWANIKVSSSSSTTTSPTVNVLTATRVCAGHDPGISNSISCSNWFRSSGETGWYSSTYGGGWYMSDKDWIRSWGSKALYINNSIRSTNYQVMYGSTSASAARLESTTTLVYGTDTSSNSINSYLRGTTVTLQVKKGTSINHNALQLTADYIYCNNYCDMKQGAVVSGGNFTVNNNSYLAQSAGAKVGIGTSSLSDSLSVNGSMNVKLTNVNWDKACTDKSLVIRKTTLDPSKVNSYEYVSEVLTFQFGDGTHSNNRGTCTVSVPAGYKIQMDVYDLKTTHNRPIANIQVSGTNTLQMTLGGGYYISGTDSANVSYFLVPDAPLDFPKTTVPQLLIADSTIQFQNSDKLLALTNKGVYINGAVNLQINGYHKQPIFIASAIYNKSSWNTIECRANAALITCNTPIADCTVNDFIVQYSGVTVTSVRIENFKFVCVLGDTNGSYYGVQIYYMPH